MFADSDGINLETAKFEVTVCEVRCERTCVQHSQAL